MTKSMFDQLKKVGLVDKKKAHKARTEKTQHAKQKGQQKKGHKTVSTESEAVQKSLQEKQLRDRALNAERKAAADRKALSAQIKQLIETHRQAKGVEVGEEGEAQNYNFLDNKIVKQMLVSAEVHQQLMRGQLAIVEYMDGYELVPLVVAERILAREPNYSVIRNEKIEVENEDDPYKDYAVPDDLMW